MVVLKPDSTDAPKTGMQKPVNRILLAIVILLPLCILSVAWCNSQPVPSAVVPTATPASMSTRTPHWYDSTVRDLLLDQTMYSEATLTIESGTFACTYMEELTAIGKFPIPLDSHHWEDDKRRIKEITRKQSTRSGLLIAALFNLVLHGSDNPIRTYEGIKIWCDTFPDIELPTHTDL